MSDSTTDGEYCDSNVYIDFTAHFFEKSRMVDGNSGSKFHLQALGQC